MSVATPLTVAAESPIVLVREHSAVTPALERGLHTKRVASQKQSSLTVSVSLPKSEKAAYSRVPLQRLRKVKYDTF